MSNSRPGKVTYEASRNERFYREGQKVKSLELRVSSLFALLDGEKDDGQPGKPRGGST